MKLRVGTRRSALARVQTATVCGRLQRLDPALEIEVVALETSGDRVRGRALREAGGKGLFVKELDLALTDRTIDCAVHSLKDVPSELAEGIALAAIPEREDPRDALIRLGDGGFDTLPRGARLGTSSPRRAALVRALRPDLCIELLRGNVETRVRSVVEGDVDATLLAVAGLRRLGLALSPARGEPIGAEVLVPAPGQGTLAVTARADDATTLALLERIDDEPARRASEAERAAARRLGGSCWLPFGAYARLEHGALIMTAVLASADGERVVRERSSDRPDQATALGVRIAEGLLAAGGADIVADLERGLAAP